MSGSTCSSWTNTLIESTFPERAAWWRAVRPNCINVDKHTSTGVCERQITICNSTIYLCVNTTCFCSMSSHSLCLWHTTITGFEMCHTYIATLFVWQRPVGAWMLLASKVHSLNLYSQSGSETLKPEPSQHPPSLNWQHSGGEHGHAERRGAANFKCHHNTYKEQI